MDCKNSIQFSHPGKRSVANLRSCEHGGQEVCVPLLPTDVGSFVKQVANVREDMVGLRSVKNVRSFFNGTAIKGKIREQYGTSASSPEGWRFGTAPSDLQPFFERAPLPWDDEFLVYMQVILSAPAFCAPPLAHAQNSPFLRCMHRLLRRGERWRAVGSRR